jgi:hypothetical protein
VIAFPNGFRDRAVSLYSSKIVDKKEIRVLCTVSNLLSVCLSVCLSVYGSTVLLLDLGSFFSFLMYTQSIGLLDGVSDRRKAATYTQNKRTQTSMP